MLHRSLVTVIYVLKFSFSILTIAVYSLMCFLFLVV